YPALANAIIVFLVLLLVLFLNKEVVIDIVNKLTNFEAKNSIPVKNRLITLGISILFIVLIISVDSLIEYWHGASKKK
ncbi:hypothetical protein, partial [Winogradskyella poriferorum]|uniref:hypothetical protein n=1 Tax=Winogradskyella poriferorum TaxID=307627 RepID=UPI003D64CE86